MKKKVFGALLLLLLCMLLLLPPSESRIAGRLKIPAHNIRAEVWATQGASCDCCPVLWQGSLVTTSTDLSAVCMYDVAHLTTLDGGRYVVECVEIMPCVRVGDCLLSWRGVVKADGDVLVYSKGNVYRFIRL